MNTQRTISLTVLVLVFVCGLSVGYLLQPDVANSVRFVDRKIEVPVPEFKVVSVPVSRIEYRGYAVRSGANPIVHDTTVADTHFVAGATLCVPDTVLPIFTACLDTTLTVGGNTLTANICFDYPSALFSFHTRNTPVSTTVSIPIVQPVTKERPLWIDILSHAGAAIGGYYIGKGVR